MYERCTSSETHTKNRFSIYDIARSTNTTTMQDLYSCNKTTIHIRVTACVGSLYVFDDVARRPRCYLSVFCIIICRKAHCLTFKLTEWFAYSTKSWVVKFNPLRSDGWTNVSTTMQLTGCVLSEKSCNITLSCMHLYMYIM